MGGNEVLVGTLHEGVRQGLLRWGVAMTNPAVISTGSEWELCGKWLFRVEDLPAAATNGPLPDGMRWDRVRKEDVGVVRARTSINRQEWVSCS